jgi:hypothetical protein
VRRDQGGGEKLVGGGEAKLDVVRQRGGFLDRQREGGGRSGAMGPVVLPEVHGRQPDEAAE